MKKIHITNLTPAWRLILEQIGVHYRQTSSVDTDILIATTYFRGLENISQPAIILTPKVAGKFLKYSTTYQKQLAFEAEFADLNPLDVHTKIFKFKNAQMLDMRIQKYKNFWILPFEVDNIILNSKTKRKKFYADRTELPSEVVSQTSKGNFRRLLQNILLKIYQQKKETYMRTSFLPQPSQNLFIFRIDTDFAKLNDSKKLFQLLQKYKLRASWFIEADAWPRLMDFYKKLPQAGHEVGLHCLRHRVFKDYDRNLDNLVQGKQKLEQNGLQPRGFVAPYGTWNENLGLALQELGFQYSSEFALDYDNLPFYPFFQQKFSTVLQIPIHPISIGRLRRSHFSEKEMIDYFKVLIKQKMAWQEPLIIYHHPGHTYWRVLETILQQVQSWQNLTMGEYADWWKQRRKILATKGNTFSQEVPVYLQKNGKYAYTTNLQTAPSELNWQPVKKAPSMVNSNLRKWSWRDGLYNYESWRGKARR